MSNSNYDAIQKLMLGRFYQVTIENVQEENATPASIVIAPPELMT